MARKTKRLEKQRLRQREYREEMREKRRPSRDDFARFALRWLILEAYEKHSGPQFKLLMDLVAKGVADQGFDLAETNDALDRLIDKYTEEGWSFRRKVHLAATDAISGS